MRGHTANELREIGNILGPDGTVRATGVPCGVTDLTGKRLDQAQLIASETTHMILFRAGDAAGLDQSCYVVVDGVTYIVDHRPLDPRIPRPGMWLEVYCHVENGGN